MNIEVLDKAIRRVPDFPKPGILFYDITGVLINPDAFKYCLDRMVEIYKDAEIDAIAAVESRGFLFAAPLAEKLKLPLTYFYPISIFNWDSISFWCVFPTESIAFINSVEISEFFASPP